MSLSRSRIKELYMRDAERARLEKEKQKELRIKAELNRVTPLSPIAGAAAGFVTGGPIGAIGGAIGGMNEKDPLKAATRGGFSGSMAKGFDPGLSPLQAGPPQNPGLLETAGRQIGGMTDPANLSKTAQYLQTIQDSDFKPLDYIKNKNAITDAEYKREMMNENQEYRNEQRKDSAEWNKASREQKKKEWEQKDLKKSSETESLNTKTKLLNDIGKTTQAVALDAITKKIESNKTLLNKDKYDLQKTVNSKRAELAKPAKTTKEKANKTESTKETKTMQTNQVEITANIETSIKKINDALEKKEPEIGTIFKKDNPDYIAIVEKMNNYIDASIERLERAFKEGSISYSYLNATKKKLEKERI